ncbi:thioredoxin [Sphingomonas sp. Leaf4]|uniref:thioredoxin n=1 Tax=Sphingomonas sp. Leaf4 TaxID=2876553 RepID=UPI001E3DA1A3|nr:thioredoxin [Sphingomonas sp. Leaf4]
MTTTTQSASADDFDRLVLSAQGLGLVDFWAPWCGPCRAMAPALEDLAADYAGDCAIIKVDIEAHPDLGKQFNIASLPTLVLFRDGAEIARVIGNKSRTQLAALLDEHL